MEVDVDGMKALDVWVDDLNEAIRAEADALRKLDADKLRRKGSFWAKLRDWLGTTPAEAEVMQVQTLLAEVKERGRAAACRWMLSEARALLDAAGEGDSYAVQKRRLECAQARAERVRRWRDLACTAKWRVSEAQEACSSASSMEMFDLLSKSKMISAVSSFSTSAAADALREADRALKSLSEALPKQQREDALGEVDDAIDLIVDLAIAPGLDVLSWFNMGKLNDAAEKCAEVQDQLRTLLKRLDDVENQVRSRVEQEADALHEIARPFLAQAAAKVPAPFHGVVPANEMVL